MRNHRPKMSRLASLAALLTLSAVGGCSWQLRGQSDGQIIDRPPVNPQPLPPLVPLLQERPLHQPDG